MFLDFDTSKDGFLSFDELKKGMKRIYGVIDQADYQSLFSNMDADGDGQINYQEFINAA